MKVGLVAGKEALFISVAPDPNYFLVRVADSGVKLRVPKNMTGTPWGHDAFRVFLPLNVIEKQLEKSFPDIEFKEANVA